MGSLSLSLGKGVDITVSNVPNLNLLFRNATIISRGGAAFPLLHPICNIVWQVIPPKCTEIVQRLMGDPTEGGIRWNKALELNLTPPLIVRHVVQHCYPIMSLLL